MEKSGKKHEKMDARQFGATQNKSKKKETDWSFDDISLTVASTKEDLSQIV